MKIERTIIVILVVAMLILSIFVGYTQYNIKEINETIDEVVDKPVSVRILSDTNSGTNPLTVNFKPLVLNNKGEIKYFWDFGDGNISSVTNPTYTYEKSGIYNCVLNIVTDGKRLSDMFNITVFPNNPPKIKIILSSTTGFVPAAIDFDVEAFDPEGENLEYLWVLKYPPLLATERTETFNTKNFSKTFIRYGNYVAELTVKDEAGNAVTDYAIIQVSQNQIIIMINSLIYSLTTFSTTLGIIGGFIKFLKIDKKIINYLESRWLNFSTGIQKIILTILSLLGITYEPPIPKAKLEFSKIADINLSPYVNETTGVVETNASVSSSFVITNIDSLNIAENIIITLKKPFTNDEGLADDLEKKELIVSIENPLGTTSSKLFFNGVYTEWQNSSFVIEKLGVGDNVTIKLTVLLEKGGVFNKGTYQCKLFAYQEKSIDMPEYIDEIPFTIII